MKILEQLRTSEVFFLKKKIVCNSFLLVLNCICHLERKKKTHTATDSKKKKFKKENTFCITDTIASICIDYFDNICSSYYYYYFFFFRDINCQWILINSQRSIITILHVTLLYLLQIFHSKNETTIK